MDQPAGVTTEVSFSTSIAGFLRQIPECVFYAGGPAVQILDGRAGHEAGAR
jgi:hypothetical protein